MLERINGEIDREVSQLLLAAEQIASNEFISDAIDSTERDHPDIENKLFKQLNNVRVLPVKRCIGCQPWNGLLQGQDGFYVS